MKEVSAEEYDHDDEEDPDDIIYPTKKFSPQTYRHQQL
jgi:hypothetical protein